MDKLDNEINEFRLVVNKYNFFDLNFVGEVFTYLIDVQELKYV